MERGREDTAFGKDPEQYAAFLKSADARVKRMMASTGGTMEEVMEEMRLPPNMRHMIQKGLVR